LGRARKVIAMPRGRYPITYSLDFVSTLLNHTQNTRNIAALLQLDARLRAQDEDCDGALDSCRGIINTSRSIGDEPLIVSMLVRIAIDHIAVKSLERTLAQGQPSAKALTLMQRTLEAEAKEPLLLIGARGERAGYDQLMEAIQRGDIKITRLPWLVGLNGPGMLTTMQSLQYMLPGSVAVNRTALLKHNSRSVEIAKLPPEEMGRAQELDAAAKKLPTLARMLASAFPKVATAYRRNQAALRCGVVMIAVERYRQAHGRWPEKLADLVPGYLAKVPTDPFDGAPLRMVSFKEGLCIYSVGPDGIDNGGQLDRDPLTKSGWDFGYRLWDVDKRRQPPKPWDKEDD
jgi:hypothetical protein